MSLETEVKAVEEKAHEVVSEVKQEVVEVADKVEATVTKEVEVAKAEVKKLTQEITAEEKLAIREIENEYLKAQIEINRLSQITMNAQRRFTATVESYTKKYVVDPAEWVFDNVGLIFRRK